VIHAHAATVVVINQLRSHPSDGRGKATHRAGEHTRNRAKDAECNAWNAGDAAGGVRCRWARDGVPMTANPSNAIAESASSTTDPDTQARRGNDGELSAGFQSDLTIDADSVDELLIAEELAAEFDDNVDDGKLYAKYRRLAAEQAALCRLATLVARGVDPLEIFRAVAEAMRRYVPADTAGLWRFESDREITVVAAAADPEALARWPVGTRTPVKGNTLATLVQRTGRPARIDSYDNVAGPIAARVRAVGVRTAVAVPIIVDGRVWGLTAVGALRHGPMPADTEVHISRFAELIATALVAGHRDQQTRQLLAEASQRSNLIDALLEGRAFDEWSLWQVAGNLRLPINGPFVVIAAHIPSAGDAPLPEIESKLRSLDIFSAWRRLPDLQVGIVHVASDHKLDRIVALMSRMTVARVGVSAAFTDLRDTPRALHFARVMLRGPTDSTTSVAVFDGSILATAAMGAPEVMIKMVGAALDGFGDLPDVDRKMLFETFRAWLDNDASVRGAAAVLICHPNTVRQRLRRIEKHTGRCLSRPRDLAELCLAFEVHRRLIEPKTVETVDERRATSRPTQCPARWRLTTPASMRC
jgi:sugar diacid utilization regulator